MFVFKENSLRSVMISRNTQQKRIISQISKTNETQSDNDVIFHAKIT